MHNLNSIDQLAGERQLQALVRLPINTETTQL